MLSIKSTRKITAATLLAAAGLLALPIASAQSDEVFNYFDTIGIGGLAAFDIGWVDPALHSYFLADRSNKSVDVIDTGTKQLTQFFPGFAGVFVTKSGATNNDLSGPDGILTFNNPASGTSEIWVGDGPQATAGCPSFLTRGCSTVKVLDASTGALTHNILTNGAARADELCHDPQHHLILIANDAESLDFAFGTPFVTFISTDTYKIVAQLLIPEATNGIEQCQYDNITGAFYLNIPEVNGPGDDTKGGAVYVISPTTFKVTAKYDIDVKTCAGPAGMALGPGNQILLGCAAKAADGVANSIIIDRTNGSTIAVAWGLGGADEVWFNPTDSHYYIAQSYNGFSPAPTPQISIIDALTGPVDQIITMTRLSGVSPHSIAVDPVTNIIYSPNAGGVNLFFPSGSDADDGATTPQPE
jgi:DNA-binding beta-propeller fold protein YncE